MRIGVVSALATGAIVAIIYGASAGSESTGAGRAASPSVAQPPVTYDGGISPAPPMRDASIPYRWGDGGGVQPRPLDAGAPSGVDAGWIAR